MRISTKGRYALRLMLDLCDKLLRRSDQTEGRRECVSKFLKNIWNRSYPY